MLATNPRRAREEMDSPFLLERGEERPEGIRVVEGEKGTHKR